MRNNRKKSNLQLKLNKNINLNRLALFIIKKLVFSLFNLRKDAREDLLVLTNKNMILDIVQYCSVEVSA